jgi:hypothetical protein
MKYFTEASHESLQSTLAETTADGNYFLPYSTTTLAVQDPCFDIKKRLSGVFEEYLTILYYFFFAY